MIKRHLKVCCVLLASLICCISAFAQAHYMKVTLRSGAVQSYALAEKPKVTFEGGNTLVIQCPDLETKYDVAEVESYSFTEDAGIAEAIADRGFVFAYADNVVNVKGEVNDVAIYSVDGKNLRQVKADDGCASINIADLNSGVYIVTINNKKSVKIIKK